MDSIVYATSIRVSTDVECMIEFKKMSQEMCSMYASWKSNSNQEHRVISPFPPDFQIPHMEGKGWTGSKNNRIVRAYCLIIYDLIC